MDQHQTHHPHLKRNALFVLFGLIASLSILWLTSNNQNQSVASGTIPIDPTTLNLQESRIESNSIKSFTVDVGIIPADIDVNYVTNNECEVKNQSGVYATSGTYSFLSGQNLVFTADVRVIDDQVVEGKHTCTATITTSSANPAYNGLQETVTANITDNDASAHTISIKSQSGTPKEGDNTKKGSYAVALADEPASSVVVTATTDDQCDIYKSSGNVNSLSVTLNASSTTGWFSVVASEDTTVEGDHTCKITHTKSTSDPDYSSASVGSISFTVQDNDSEEQVPDKIIPDEDLVTVEPKTDEGILDDKDADNDGVEDSTQPNVATTSSPINAQVNALRVDEVEGETSNCSVINQFDINEPEFDGDKVFPYGAFNFELTCTEPGASADITIIMHNNVTEENKWLVTKFVEPDQFIAIPDAKIVNKEVQNGTVTSIVYTVTDGGRLDTDGELNGRITDPIGLMADQAETHEDDDTETQQRQDEVVVVETGPPVSLILLTVFAGLLFGGGMMFFKFKKSTQSKKPATNAGQIFHPEKEAKKEDKKEPKDKKVDSK